MKLVWIKLIPWNWKNRITIASKKIARVTAALEQGLGLRLLRTDIDEVFHPLEKRTNKKQKPRWIESFERWMTERRWRFYVPWRWHLIFQTARFVRQDKKSIVFSLSWSQTTFSTDDLYYITAYSRIHVGTYGCSLLFPSMSTNRFQQWRIFKGNPKRNHLMTTQMLTQYLNRGRISYLMPYALSAKKQQYSWF